MTGHSVQEDMTSVLACLHDTDSGSESFLCRPIKLELGRELIDVSRNISTNW